MHQCLLVRAVILEHAYTSVAVAPLSDVLLYCRQGEKKVKSKKSLCCNLPIRPGGRKSTVMCGSQDLGLVGPGSGIDDGGYSAGFASISRALQVRIPNHGALPPTTGAKKWSVSMD